MHIALAACMLAAGLMQVPPEAESTVMDPISAARWHFDGAIGERLDANVAHWLLRAPGANPGLLNMFRRRDRHWPYKEIVPWAGEFAGKYLIGAVQARRMANDPRVDPFLRDFVAALIGTQAENGYLGPFRKNEQLLGHWDLWGHYHVMLGLLMWHDDTGDEAAFEAAERAAALICDRYEDEHRPIEAGAPECNFAVLDVLADLYARTGNPRYKAVINRIEEDMQKAGDWLRLGAGGTPYYKLPRNGTRWESLHIVQGFLDLYLLTGAQKYKDAFVNLWESIRNYERHPSGAFSTGESARGSIYEKGAIETCCSIAWAALTIDMLRLTGDPRAADELELATYNQFMAAQHPSGNWCTYDNPINGVRVPAYQHIDFQYRPGTPAFNCCSANFSRGFGMLSEWAVMKDPEGLVVNFYGPYTATIPWKDQHITLRQKTGYPVDGKVRIFIEPEQAVEFRLRLRVPAWSGEDDAGAYRDITRTWEPGETVALAFDMCPRFWVGKGPAYAGRAAVFKGPLLLAYDAQLNDAEVAECPPIDLARLECEPVAVEDSTDPTAFPPLGLWEFQTPGGTVRLCDFGSAGAAGTEYAAWLPAVNAPPQPAALALPEPGASGKPGPMLFMWESAPAPGESYRLAIGAGTGFNAVVREFPGIEDSWHMLKEPLPPGRYCWRVITENAREQVANEGGPRTFEVAEDAAAEFYAVGESGLLAAAALDGDPEPEMGILDTAENLKAAAGPWGKPSQALQFNGKDSALRYRVPFFPRHSYTFHAWVCPEGLPVGDIQQIGSFWCGGMNDPLRVTLQGNEVFARIESGGVFSTAGVPLEDGVWTHVAAVKQGATLRLYVNGELAHESGAPAQVSGQCRLLGIGYNPLYAGGEHFKGRIAGFAFYARALNAEEIAERYRDGVQR